MQQLLNFFFLGLTSFFTLVNPLGVMPVFLGMTQGLTPRARQITARKAVLVAGGTMLGFAFTGQLLFDFFQISVHSLRVVGGILFFVMGFDMLQARLARTKMEEGAQEHYAEDISITPLGIPMICGPGAITNAIVMMEDASTWALKGVLILSILLVSLATYLILRGSEQILRLLGETGNKVMMRLMGLIVMVIAVEFFFSGLRPLLAGIFPAAA
jgi:multiple antibiotic resistance protein